jgi:hypothetical protein
MKESGHQNESPLEASSDKPTAYYLYLITGSEQASSGTESLPQAIEDGATLEWVGAGELAALSSRVPLSDYDEESLAANLTNASWTAVRAMRHEHVVEHFTRRSGVVPLRFGTIYLERSGVERMLRERATELVALKERLTGKEEWGVNVFSDRTQLLDGITSVSARLRDLVEQASNATPGQAYLIQKKIATLKTDEARSELARIIDEIEKVLTDTSEEAHRLRVLKVESTEHGELKAKFAFLIPRSSFEEFREAAETLARQYQSAGIRLELTGPWPAYNFTS